MVGSNLALGRELSSERYYDWARVKLSCHHPEGFSRWFLFRRCPEHPDDPSFISYYQVFAPSDTSLETMVGVAGRAMAHRGVFSIYQEPTWFRGLRSALMDGLVSPHHFGPSRRRQSLSVLRYQAEPLGELSTPPFFSPQVRAGSLVAFKAVRGPILLG